MIRRLPFLPTVIVLIAVGIMVRLGFWQIDRLHQKEALLAHYAAGQAMSAEVDYPSTPGAVEGALYRHSSVECATVAGVTSMSGTNRKGEAGIAHIAECRTPAGAAVRVVLGWSRDPHSPVWQGGKVSGIIAPGPRLVVDPPLAGLEANGVPDPSTIPNNHLAYAVQWFLFAGVALIIYGLALRKRLAAGKTPG